MQKVIVRFIPEWMSIINILPEISFQHNYNKLINQYIKKRNFELNYLEYILLKELYPNIFEKFSFSFYSYWDESSYYFNFDNFLDFIIKFNSIHSFHWAINNDTKNLFLWNQKWIEKIFSLIKKQIIFSDVVSSFISFRNELTSNVKWKKNYRNYYYFLNTLFFIKNWFKYSISDDKMKVVCIDIKPNNDFRKIKTTLNNKLWIFDFTLTNFSKYFNYLDKEKFDNLYFISKNFKNNNTKIKLLKDFFITHQYTWSNVYKYSPYDFIDIKQDNKNLFIIFNDSEFFYNKLSYNKNYWILIN